MGALVFAQIPDTNVATAVTRDQLALIWMNDNIVDGGHMGEDVLDGSSMSVIPLNAARPRIPYLDRSVLGAGDHPFALAMESNTGHIARMAIKTDDRAWVCRSDIVELDVMVSGRGQIAFVGRDAQTIDLRVGMLNSSRTDAGKSFPESDGMIITSYFLFVFQITLGKKN